MIQIPNPGNDDINEECGVFGIYDFDGGDVASDIYYGLFALQHRGQESAGIAVTDTRGPAGAVSLYKNMGLVNEVFDSDILSSLKGDMGVGHVRYSTAGSSVRENAQPLVINYIKGSLSLAHNGNLINAAEMRHELAYTGAIFQTAIDSELIAYNIARERLNSKTVEEAVRRAAGKIRGAYSLAIASSRKLIGVRDPYGFRPLSIGKMGNAYILSSETCAIESVGGEFIRDVLPGEIVTITREKGITSDMSMAIDKARQGRCVFEYIYFARPDSYIDGVSVYDARFLSGRFLAKDSPADADLIIGVPESGTIAAMGFAEESRIPYGAAFVKNTYVGRTFIRPEQNSRKDSVNVKLNIHKELIKDKRVVIIDDSIVRGTTSSRLVKMLRDAGAKEVHFRIASPPFMWQCFFGTDIPERRQLIAYRNTMEEIRDRLNADSLAYLSSDRLDEIAGGLPVCKGCFTGSYPLDPPDKDIRGEYSDRNSEFNDI
ncbi:MAG: amidophosphoribosyltransferase [Clostridia bacterium]|nr:amidophosphoribosyltransferase [Clostridia bacterium]